MSIFMTISLGFACLAVGYAAGLRTGIRRRRDPALRGPTHRVSSDRRPVVR